MIDDNSKEFIKRHIGPSEEDQSKMLKKLKYKSLNDLIDNTVPEKIQFKGELNIGEPNSEYEALRKLKASILVELDAAMAAGIIVSPGWIIDVRCTSSSSKILPTDAFIKELSNIFNCLLLNKFNAFPFGRFFCKFSKGFACFVTVPAIEYPIQSIISNLAFFTVLAFGFVVIWFINCSIIFNKTFNLSLVAKLFTMELTG